MGDQVSIEVIEQIVSVAEDSMLIPSSESIVEDEHHTIRRFWY